MDVGLLLLRLVTGLLFIGHGTQKLFGWFGGYGVDGTAGFMGSLRFRFPRAAAILVGVLEVTAGAALAAGFVTPLAAAAIVGIMIVAALSANWSRGLFGGYELDLVNATIAAALAFTGAGAYSLDAAASWNLGGGAWGLFALALAVVAATAVLASRHAVPHAVAEVGTGEDLAA